MTNYDKAREIVDGFHIFDEEWREILIEMYQEIIGWTAADRTRDLRINSSLLYQLSYSPTKDLNQNYHVHPSLARLSGKGPVH